ncbi:MAG: hypothetical protein JSW08_00310 [archaeon]|nr:MAG: hypothetical protein JSW08_00310 [archaeon]
MQGEIESESLDIKKGQVKVRIRVHSMIGGKIPYVFNLNKSPGQLLEDFRVFMEDLINMPWVNKENINSFFERCKKALYYIKTVEGTKRYIREMEKLKNRPITVQF